MPHEPKKRHSRARQGKRREAIKLADTSVAICSNCGSAIAPHSVCTACGYYKGKQVLSR